LKSDRGILINHYPLRSKQSANKGEGKGEIPGTRGLEGRGSLGVKNYLEKEQK